MVANEVQRRDRGIDGRGMLLHPVIEKGKKKRMILAQVRVGKPPASQVRDFANVIQNTEGAVAGVFITVEPVGREGDGTEEMRRVAAQLGTFQHEHSMVEFQRLQFWHVGQFFYESAVARVAGDGGSIQEGEGPHQANRLLNENEAVFARMRKEFR